MLVPSFLMIAYTFRINEINVFFYQQGMKQLQKYKQRRLIRKDKSVPKTKYEQYVIDNYFTLSFKVAFGKICKALHLDSGI